MGKRSYDARPPGTPPKPARRSTSRLTTLRTAGLMRAKMEGRCRVKHAEYLKNLGYVYCPWCGQELLIRHHCTHCNRDFTSTEAFVVHQNLLTLYIANPCLNATRTDAPNHAVKWQPRRDSFYCPACHLEYPAVHPDNEKGGEQ